MPKSNTPDGRYASMDDGSRSGQVLYGQDDEMQLWARGIIETDGAGNVTLVGGKGIASVALRGDGLVDMTLLEAQSGNHYVVLSGQAEAGGNRRHIATSDKLQKSMVIGLRGGDNVIVDLNIIAGVFSFAVCKA